MPVAHRRHQRVPIDLPPQVLELLESVSSSTNVPRTKLMRLFVIDGLQAILSRTQQDRGEYINNLFSLESPIKIAQICDMSKSHKEN